MSDRRNVLEEKGTEKECKTELPADWAVTSRLADLVTDW